MDLHIFIENDLIRTINAAQLEEILDAEYAVLKRDVLSKAGN